MGKADSLTAVHSLMFANGGRISYEFTTEQTAGKFMLRMIVEETHGWEGVTLWGTKYTQVVDVDEEGARKLYILLGEQFAG